MSFRPSPEQPLRARPRANAFATFRPPTLSDFAPYTVATPQNSQSYTRVEQVVWLSVMGRLRNVDVERMGFRILA